VARCRSKVPAAYALMRILSSALYSVVIVKWKMFSGVKALLALAALMAAYFPAGRAARVDPVIALRDESPCLIAEYSPHPYWRVNTETQRHRGTKARSVLHFFRGPPNHRGSNRPHDRVLVRDCFTRLG
jgi:hypothetical protein